MDDNKKEQLKQLEAEIERQRIRAQHTPEAMAWYGLRLDRLELIWDLPRLSQKSDAA